MNLGVFLAIGESFQDFKNKGQDDLLLKYNLKTYSESFDKVFIFSYLKESYCFYKNIYFLPNKYNLHRYLYAILLPLFYPEIISDCGVFRGLQLTGGIPGLLTKLLYKKKLIINYGYPYSQVARLEGKVFRSYLYQLLEKIILPVSDTVIITNKKFKKHIGKYVSKINYIPNGVDINSFKPENIKKRYTCLFVGRLEKQKNLAVLISALSLLRNKKQRTALFIGNGSLKKELLVSASEHKVKVTIIDKVSHTRLPDYYNQSIIFVLPSYTEGNPKVLLEAMSCGLPVIGNKVEGISSIVKPGQNGLLFDNNDKELYKYILNLLNSKTLRKRLGTEARKYIGKYHNYRKLKSDEIEILKKYAEK